MIKFLPFYLLSVILTGASDIHSGINKIKYRFRAQKTGTLVNNKEYEYNNPSRVNRILISFVFFVLFPEIITEIDNWKYRMNKPFKLLLIKNVMKHVDIHDIYKCTHRSEKKKYQIYFFL